MFLRSFVCIVVIVVVACVGGWQPVLSLAAEPAEAHALNQLLPPTESNGGLTPAWSKACCRVANERLPRGSARSSSVRKICPWLPFTA